MNIQPTLEVRWFFDELPFAIERLFGGFLAQDRIDWYALPCHEGCGMKLREGRLETKLRQQSEGEFSLGSVVGAMESWFKWSVPMPSDNMPTTSLLKGTGWVPVHKRRWIRRYAVTSEGHMEVMNRVASGCAFELTQLEVHGQTFYTVGYEAVGREDSLRQYLDLVANEIHAKYQFASGQFQLENSYGYPCWLNRLT